MFEITLSDFKNGVRMNQPINMPVPVNSGIVVGAVIPLRDLFVLQTSDIAEMFQVETREINQTIKRNQEKFPEDFAFQLTKAELESLRSLGVIPKPKRGGSRARPWVVTRKGVLQLILIMDKPKTNGVGRILIEILDSVLTQMYSQDGVLALGTDSRAMSEYDESKLEAVQSQFIDAIGQLMSTVVNQDTNSTVEDELYDVAGGAIEGLKESFRTKKLKNNQITAESELILEQARDLRQRRDSELKDAELNRDEKSLDLIMKRIEVAERLLLSLKNFQLAELVQQIGQLPSLTNQPTDKSD